MALTWAGVITILFLAAACVRGYRRGLIKELVSLVCVFLSMAIVCAVKASACIECGKCETRCPYHLPIREMLKECAQQFGE